MIKTLESKKCSQAACDCDFAELTYEIKWGNEHVIIWQNSAPGRGSKRYRGYEIKCYKESTHKRARDLVWLKHRNRK